MKRRRLAVLLVAAVAVWLGGCRNEGPDKQPDIAASSSAQAGRPDDGAITTRVQAKFYQSRSVKTADIDVETSDGVVTLEGTVASSDVRQEAVNQARGVEGVVRVEDQLEVRAPEATATTGARPEADEPAQAEGGRAAADRDLGDHVSSGFVTAKIQAQYFGDDDVKGRNIDVDTVNGVVTLRGEVDSARSRERAVEIARQTEGVTRVDDRLAVKPRDASAPPAPETGAAGSAPEVRDEDISTRIQSKYFANDELRASHITVTTKNGVVTLGRTVTSEGQREEAVAVARNTNGVSQVNDEISLQAAPAGTSGSAPRSLDDKLGDAWITTKVQSKFFLDASVKSGNVNVVSKNGTVTLAGFVSSADARRKAVEIAQATEGVVKVVDRLKVQEPERR